MKMVLMKFLILIFLVVSPFAIAQEDIPYQPQPDAPTHEKMFEEVFGVPEDATYLPEVFANSQPHELMADVLYVLWIIAIITFVIIISVQVVSSTINAPTSRTILGDNVGTAFAPIRVVLAFFLLITIPDGKHYSMIESIILSVNKFTSAKANDIYISGANKMVRSDSSLNFKTASLFVSEDAALNIFKGAMCVEYLVSQGEADVISQESLSKSSNYQLLFGQRTNISFEPIFSIGSAFPVEGGCGQWYSNIPRPRGLKLVEDGDVDTSAFVHNTSPAYILQILQMGVNHRSLVSSELYTEFRELSAELINREEGTKDQYFVGRFDEIVNDFNEKATKMLREKLTSDAIQQILSSDEQASIKDSINNGWFFAGAMPFALASVHDKYQSFKRTSVLATAPVPENFYQHEDELQEHMGYLDKLIKGNRSQIDPATSLVNENIRSDIGGYGSCVMDMHGLFDCFGQVATLEVLHLADGLKSGEVHPLVFTHDVGSQGANELLSYQLLLNTAYVASSAAVGFSDNGYVQSGFLSFITHATHATVEILRSNSGFVIKYLMVLYAFLGYYIPMMPMLYFMVAVVSYIIMLFVSLLSANFFAVSHAWLEGQGFVSSYAQRGYPSLIFSALHPIFIVGAFFIYLFSIEFVFKYVAYAFSIGMTQLVSIMAPDIFAGIVIFTVFVGLLIAIHRLLAKGTIDMPDRVMRVIGVHEGLASNDFTNSIEQKASSDSDRAISEGSDKIDNMAPKSSAPIDAKHSGSASHASGGNSSQTSVKNDSVMANQKVSDTAKSQHDNSHEPGSHFADGSNNNSEINSSQSSSESQGALGDSQGQNGDQQQSQQHGEADQGGEVDSGGFDKGVSDSASGKPRQQSGTKAPHPHNTGVTGAAMNAGMMAGKKLSELKNSKQNSSQSDKPEPNESDGISSNRSQEIKEAQEITSKMDDSANRHDTSELSSNDDPINDNNTETSKLSDRSITDKEFEEMNKNDEDEDGPVK